MPEEEARVESQASQSEQIVVETPSVETAAIEKMTQAFKLKGVVPQTDEAAPEQAVEKKQEEAPVQEVKADTAPVEANTEAAEVPPDVVPEGVTIDHNLQTYIGRKVAEHARKQAEPLVAEIQSLREQLAQAQAGAPPNGEAQKAMDTLTTLLGNVDPEEYVTTKGEVLDLLEKAFPVLQSKTQEQATVAQKQFTSAYISNLSSLAAKDNLDPDMREEVAKELDTVLRNPLSHSDPTICAERNYSQALKNVLFRKATTKPVAPTIPVNGTPPLTATGLSTGSKTETSKPTVVNLDDRTMKFLKSIGKNTDWALEKLRAK